VDTKLENLRKLEKKNKKKFIHKA